MKKTLHFALLLLAGALFLGLGTGRVEARLTGATGNAETCWGAAGVEVCVDTSGNWIPTTTAIGDLGLTGLRWKNLWLSGNAAIGGTLAVTGAETHSAALSPWSRTKAQFNAITPAAAGEVYFCSDCTAKNICVSTGTTLSGFLRVDSTTIGCGTGE